MHLLHMIFLVIFWCSVGGVLYAYALYPAVLLILARTFGKEPAAPELGDVELPFISLLIAAHNEEGVIGERIKNALALDYPADRLEVVIASDGSDDRTTQIVQRYVSEGIRLLDFPLRRGKATVLNDAVKEVRGAIVLLSDANTHTHADAARKLVRWFADPKIGAVCGKLILTDPASGENADGIYWKYETFLKRNESRLGALLGSNGAIYAIRREQLQPIPSNTIIDDFVIPLLAKQRTGCRIVFDDQAIAREETAPDVGSEFRRRTRIGAGGWQAISMLWRLLNPARGWVAFTFFSHKLLRWVCPFFLLFTFTSTLLLSGWTFFRVLLIVQVGLYLVALLGGQMPRGGQLGRLIKVIQMFAGMNLALLLGFFRWLAMPQTGMWTRTMRQVEAQGANSAPAVSTQL